MSASRIDGIVDVLLAYAKQDFRPKAPVSEALDGIDAIAVGVNMLAEELDGEVASRRELEAAYRALKRTQSKLVQSEKLASIGQLASGVAHEIHNPAGWVLLALGMMDQKLGELQTVMGTADGTPAVTQALFQTLRSCLRDATEGMDRIDSVAKQLRSYSRASSEQREVVELNPIVEASCRLALPIFPSSGPTLRLELAAGLPPMRGDARRLGQIVTNLLVNAAHALGASARTDTDADVVLVSTYREDWQVVLRVDDSGPGIPPTLRSRIFEPFFTTKSPDEGTGLGLALVEEMVAWHGGTIALVPGKLGGACFEIRFPVVERELVVETPVAELAPEPRTTGHRILFLDDEKTLLRLYRLSFGSDHEVLTAATAEEAEAVLLKNPAIDVLFGDLNLRDVDGTEFYRQAFERWPELRAKTVIVTGGAQTTKAEAFLSEFDLTVLEKPARLEAIVQAMAQVAGVRPAKPSAVLSLVG